MNSAALAMPTLTSDVLAYRPMHTDIECFKSANDPALWAASIQRPRRTEALANRVMSNARSRIGEGPFAEAVKLRMDAINLGRHQL